MVTKSVYLDLDRAWEPAPAGLPTIDAAEWGPHLRFSAPPRLVERFYAEVAPQLPPFIVYGSGDFHHLSALWLRRASAAVVLVSFDNHPDWDIRPPKWGCGSWINRALDLPQIEKASVWGCGNFECWWPGQLWGNRRAERAGRLEVHPWADGRSEQDQQRRGAITQRNWRDRFAEFVTEISGRKIYVTIDMDCLDHAHAVTNWENGRFDNNDLSWAVQRLRESCAVVAGDICGAYSKPKYSRWKQQFASNMDHPKVSLDDTDSGIAINTASVEALLPILAG